MRPAILFSMYVYGSCHVYRSKGEGFAVFGGFAEVLEGLRDSLAACIGTRSRLLQAEMLAHVVLA